MHTAFILIQVPTLLFQTSNTYFEIYLKSCLHTIGGYGILMLKLRRWGKLNEFKKLTKAVEINLCILLKAV